MLGRKDSGPIAKDGNDDGFGQRLLVKSGGAGD